MPDPNLPYWRKGEPFKLDRIIETSKQAWGDLQKVSNQPEPGSKLALISEEASIKGIYLPTMLAGSVQSSIHCLYSIVNMFLGPPPLNIEALYTVLRTSLLGSARPLWVLLPSDVETCVSRGKMLIKDEYSQVLKGIKSTAHFESMEGITTAEDFVQHLKKIKEEQRKSVQNFTSGQLLQEYAKEVEIFAGNNPSKDRRYTTEHIMLLWNVASTFAHAPGWPQITSNTTANLMDQFFVSLETVSVHCALASFKLRESSIAR